MTTGEPLTFRALLKRHRAALGLTQEELAERARLSVQTISTLERGTRHTPHRDTVRLLVEALELDGEDRTTFERAARRIGPPHDNGSGVADESLPVGRFLGALPARSFVARDEELERIRFALETVEGGAAQFLLLAGEPGVGKTRQAQEVMLLARERGFVVGTGRCYAEEEGVGLYPLQELLQTAVATAPPPLRTPGRWSQVERLRDLAAHGPWQRPDLPGSELDRDQRRHLYEQLTDFFVGIAAEEPLALLLDDLHWADEAILELLRHLARRTRSHRILLLGAYRHTELDADHPLTRMVRDLSREGLAERMLLRRLTIEETAALVASRVGALDGADDFVEFVQRRSKGIPLYVENMVQALGDRYRLVRQIGAGGMGRVFEAVDTQDGRRVAAKLMLARAEADPRALQRLRQEGAVLATLDHPNIVRLYDTLLQEHACSIIMELVEGQSLGQLLRSQPDRARMPFGRIWNLMEQVVAALECAHGRGIVHRDIKPDNIMITEGDRVKVTDFGIARLLRPSMAGTTQTTTGMTLGTPLYMAPEQVQDRPVDGRTDIYSLGCVLYELVTGRPPYVGEDPFAVALARVLETPRPPGEVNREVPDDWSALILRMLAKEPDQRYQTVADLRKVIEALSTKERPLPLTYSAARPPSGADAEAPEATETSPQGTKQTAARLAGAARRPVATRVAGRLAGAGAVATLAAVLAAALLAAGVFRTGSTRSTKAQDAFSGMPVAIWGTSQQHGGHFQNPDGIAVDAHGNVYVADAQTNSIQLLSPTGQPISRFGATGTGPGQFNNPRGVAVDSRGNVYVADSGNNRIQKLFLDPTRGTLVPVAQWGGAGSGHEQFQSPEAVTVNRRGDVFVADTDNNRVQELSPEGQPLAEWSGAGRGHFDHPNGVAVDGQGNIYVSEAYSTRIQKLSSIGQSAGSFNTGGTGCNCAANIGDPNPDAGFYPSGLAVDARGDMYAADAFDGLVQKFNRAGVPIGFWDTRTGPLRGKLQFPDALAVDARGAVYVANAGGGYIDKFFPPGRLVAQWSKTGSSGVRFYHPFGVAVDAKGNVYVADQGGDQVHELSPSGRPLGLWGASGSLPGQFDSPQGVAVDAKGNVYVADTVNNRIEKLGRNGQFTDFWNNPAFVQPQWLAIDGQGSIYASVWGDTPNGMHGLPSVVKISSTGKGLDRWTYWAESSYRSSAQLNGLVIDPAGELYVTDGVGETVQKFSSRKQPLLRWGAPGSDVGDFNDPMGLALDSRGDVFVVDPLNARVQEFSSSGRFLRAWGTEGSGPGQFSDPNGIAVDAQGNVYVTDTLNNRIQKFSP